ncbi:MAG: hypothetical protein GXX99_04605 [Clostridiales bacterium]|nr:hypothetical protein [Clostridiales bacterium]
MRHIAKRLSALLAALLLAGLAACGSKEAAPPEAVLRDRMLRLPTLSLPYTFNPVAVYEGAEPISENLFSKALKLNAAGQVIPDLAELYEYNEDCTRLTLTFRRAVKWHDGELCTAYDAEWTYQAIRTQQGLLASQFADVRSVRAADSSRLEIEFAKPSPFFIYTLTEDGACILPKHLYEGRDWLTAEAATTPVGTGPFRFVERVEGERVVLERNSDYFGGTPKIQRILFQLYPSAAEARAAFDRGELEALTTGLPLSAVQQQEEKREVNLFKIDDATRILLCFNEQSALFKDNPQLRRAIAQAVDREAILQEGMRGVGAASYSFISPLFQDALSATAVVPAHNPAKAVEQLASKYDKGEDGNYVRATLKVYDAEPYVEIAAILKRNLDEVGVEVTVIPMDFNEWQETVFTQGDFEMTLYGGYQGPYAEAILHRVAIDGQLNFTGYHNAALSDKLYEAFYEPLPGRRNSLMRDVQDILAQQLPMLPIAEWYTVIPVRSYVTDPPQGDSTVSANEYSKAELHS